MGRARALCILSAFLAAASGLLAPAGAERDGPPSQAAASPAKAAGGPYRGGSAKKGRGSRYRIGGIVYAMLLDHWGRWSGPRLPTGEPDFSVIDDILALRPTHLRLTQPPNRCLGDECPTLQPHNQRVLEQLLRLRNAGIKIGAALNIAREIRNGRKRRRSPDEVVRHACRIKRADVHGIYNWLFLDFAAEAKRAKQITRHIATGKDCPAGGWRVMVNASGISNPKKLPRHAVAHARRFGLLVAPRRTVRRRVAAASAGRGPVLTAKDRRFVRGVRRHRPHALPLLKLEIPNQSGRVFASLSLGQQKELLRRWARAQRRHRFRMIYPLFIYPGGRHPVYDSRRQGTFELIASLLRRDLGRARR